MKLIDLLLRLYPEDFRARFGRDMRSFHDERVREDRRWTRIVRDHVASAATEHARTAGRDVRYALRAMARQPLFAAGIVLTIALGVGANAAIFSVVDGVLLRPLPYPGADRLFAFGHQPPQWLVSEPQYAEYRQKVPSIASLAAFTKGEGNLLTRQEPERIGMAAVTRNFFDTLGASPMLGRSFAPGEDAVRPANVVILSHRLWQTRFGGDPGVVGQAITFNGRRRTVVGVMPPSFVYPSTETQIWLPICSQRACASLTTLEADSRDGWVNHYLWLVGRMRRDATLTRLRSEASTIARTIERTHPENFDPGSPLLPDIASMHDALVGGARPYLVALLGAVGFVLLIVCVNVANLLLARSESRRREMAIRTVLGASRRRLRTQMLTESLVFAAAGGSLGLALAIAGTRILVAMAPPSLPRLEEIRLDWHVLAFGLAVSLVAGLLFGLTPAIRASRQAPAESLQYGARGHGDATSGRARRALVVAEITLAMMMLTGAGMLLRSLVHLHDTDLGFRAGGVLTAKVSPNIIPPNDARAVRLYQEVLARVRVVPGVQAAGAARWLPVVDAGGLWDIVIEGKAYPPGRGPTAVPQEITPGYFAAMGMRILRGRDISDRDRAGAPLVAVVSESFARTIWPGEDPLGRRFRMGGRDGVWMSVVGVANDILSRGFTDRPEPTMYVPHAQAAESSYYTPTTLTLIVRTGGGPEALGGAVRAAVHSVEPAAPVSSVRTLETVVGTSTANRRFSTGLIIGFAVLALLLAGIGVYGVISYSVSERTFEIGVRMALGADRRSILRFVVADGARMALAGIVLGAIGSAVLARGIRSLLVGVRVIDPGAMLASVCLLSIVALIASALPARRAAVVNPTDSLRGRV